MQWNIILWFSLYFDILTYFYKAEIPWQFYSRAFSLNKKLDAVINVKNRDVLFLDAKEIIFAIIIAQLDLMCLALTAQI